MAQVLVEEQSLSDTAAAIRSRLGGQDTYKPREFAAAINSIVDYATVTQTLTNASSSSSKTKAVKGESFTADITPDSGYRITAITVTMGGVDITSQVFKPGTGAKAITTNGTYTAASDNLSGYDTVTVAVPSSSPNLGTKTITANGTYAASSDSLDGYSSVTVNVSGGGSSPVLQSKTATPTESTQAITPDSGYDGLSSVEVGAISSTYVGSGITRQAAATITPSASSQTAVAANVYTTGAVTVDPIPSQYIVPSGSQTITSNGTVDVTSLAEVVVNVSSGNSLPSGYTSRSYIQSAGDAYIDTGVREVAGILSGIWGKFAAHVAGSDNKTLFGYQGSSLTSYRLMVFLSTSNALQYYAAQSGAGNLSGWTDQSQNEISVDLYSNASYPVFKINGTQITGTKKKTTSKNATQGNMYLLAQNYQSTGPTTGEQAVDGSWIRCYGFKIYCYEGLIRDFVPCTRDADSVAGFYDFITETFYPSIGANAFTYG